MGKSKLFFCLEALQEQTPNRFSQGVVLWKLSLSLEELSGDVFLRNLAYSNLRTLVFYVFCNNHLVKSDQSGDQLLVMDQKHLLNLSNGLAKQMQVKIW